MNVQTEFIPGKLRGAKKPPADGSGIIVAGKTNRKPALYAGAEFVASLEESADLKKEREHFDSEEGKKEHTELCATIKRDLAAPAVIVEKDGETKSKDNFPAPPADEPILIRRAMVTAEGLFLEEAVDKVVWVNRSINLIAQNIASVPLRVMRRKADGSNAEPDVDTPAARKLLRLLERPNAHQSGSDLIEAIVFWMMTRQCLLWMMGNKREFTKPNEMTKTPPVALYCLPAHRCTGMMDGGSLLYYRVNGSGKSIPAWQVIRLGFYNPKEELRCLSPLSAAYQCADMDYATELFNANFFDSGLKPSGPGND